MSLINEMREKIRIVITFIALLELARSGRIKIKGSSDFNDFVIYIEEDGQHLHTHS